MQKRVSKVAKAQVVRGWVTCSPLDDVRSVHALHEAVSPAGLRAAPEAGVAAACCRRVTLHGGLLQRAGAASGVKANSNLPRTVARRSLASRESGYRVVGTEPNLSPLRYLTSRIFEEGVVILLSRRKSLVRSQVDAREQPAQRKRQILTAPWAKRCTQTVTLSCRTACITRYTKWQCEHGPIPSD